jgi:hypothetical protein
MTFDEHVQAIRQAIHLGIMAEELPNWEPEFIEHLALWLASEHIGEVP